MALPEMPPLEDPDDGDLADLLDWHEVLAESPTVIGMKTGRVMACASYVCPDTEAMHPLTRAHYLARLHEVLMLLAEDWTVDFDWWHLPAPEYPETRWRHPVDWLFDEVRRLSFHAYPRYASTATMSLTWVPPRGRRRWLRELFLTRTLDRAVRSDLDYDLMLFQQGALRFFQYLRPLGLTVEPLDADATCTYLHQTISWKHHRVRCPWPATFLDGQLKDEPFVPGADGDEGGGYHAQLARERMGRGVYPHEESSPEVPRRRHRGGGRAGARPTPRSHPSRAERD
jgi:type IV secretion system protein TrbE